MMPLSDPESIYSGFFQSVDDADSEVVRAGDVTPDEAIALMVAGNHRFCSKQTIQRPLSTSERVHLAEDQHPFVAVLGCSDSRVPVEVVFDRLPGDVFVVRVAGHVASPETVASLEFAVMKLGVPLIMVLGHERCGAVAAAAAATAETKWPGQVGQLVHRIEKALENCTSAAGARPHASELEKANIIYQIQQLSHSPVIAEAVRVGRLKIVGAYFTIADGHATLLPGADGTI